MEANLMIAEIRGVFDGTLKVGSVPRTGMLRYSDCFVYFLEGVVDYSFRDGTRFTALPQTFIYLPKDGAYSMEVREKSSYLYVDFDFIWDGSVQQGCLFDDVPIGLKNDFTKLYYLWTEKRPWYRADAAELLYRIYATGLRSLHKKYGKSNAVFSDLMEYIGNRYTEADLNVRSLIAYSGLSETHLRRLFQAGVGMSPMRYVTYLRLEKAKHLLLNTNYSISEVGYAVGLEDPYYFSRVFKKEIGTSPSQYRSVSVVPESKDR